MPSLARSFIVVALAASISPNRQLEAQSLPEIASVATDRGRISDRGAWSLTESPDGNLVAFVAHDSIRVYNRRQRTAVAIAPAGAGIGELNWSRRGGMLSFGRQEERGRRSMPWVIPVEPSTGRAAGAARQVSMRPMNRFDEAPVFSPDDRFIAFASNSGDTGSVVVVPSNGGRERILFATGGSTQDASISPDGKWVYFSASTPAPARRRTLRRVPFAGGVSDSLAPLAVESFFIGVSADGTQLAWYGDGHPRSSAHRSIVIATADGKPIGALRDPAGVIKHWSSKPGVLLAKKVDFTFATRTVPVAGGPITSLGHAGPLERPLIWSTDNRQLLAQGSTETTRWLVLTTRGDTVRRIQAPAVSSTLRDRDGGGSPAWSPDGRYVAYPAASIDGSKAASRLMLIEIATGTVRVLTEADDGIGAIRWRSDGQAVQYVLYASGSQAVREVSLSGSTKALSPVYASNRVRAVWPITDTTALLIAGDSLSLVSSRGTFIRMIRQVKTNSAGRFLSDFVASADGQFVAFIEDAVSMAPRHVIQIVPTSGAPIRTIQFDLESAIWYPRFAGSDAIVFYRNGKKVDIFAVSLSGGVPRNLTAADTVSDIDEMTISPDGRTVAYQAELGPNFPTRLIDIDVSAGARR